MPRHRSGPSLIGLGHRYLVFCGGRTLSILGDSLTQIALPFAVLQAGGSVLTVGIAQAARWLPVLLLSLLGGAIGDRYSRRTVIVSTDIIAGLSTLTLAAILFASPREVVVQGFLVGVSLVLGATSAIRTPALMGAVTDLVPLEHRHVAVAWNSTFINGAATVGPALGGVLVTLSPAGVVFLVDAVTFFVAAVIFLFDLDGRGMQRGTGRITSEIGAGLRYVAAREWLIAGIGATAVYQLFFMPTLYILGPVISNSLPNGAALWGLSVSFMGAGSVFGSWLVTRWEPSNRAAVSIAMLCLAPAATLALALGLPPSVVVCGFALTGLVRALSQALWHAEILTSVPDELVARVVSVNIFGSLILKPIGQFGVAAVAVAIGLGPTVGFAAGLSSIACAGAALRISTHTRGKLPAD